LVLTPARLGAAAVQAKLEALGITDQDIVDAIAWARGKR
jgi:predicted metal-dependent phosphoesterase TrpH